MKDLLIFLALHLSSLLEAGWFRITNSDARDGHGSVLLESSATRMMFVWERSEMSVRIQPKFAPEDDWFWIGVIRRVILGEKPGVDVLDESAAAFLQSHLPAIDAAFADVNSRSELVGRLREGREARSRELFG